MTRIIVVDDQDNPIGFKDRHDVTHQDIYRVSGLWLTNTTGEVLIAQRKLTKSHDPGKWGPAVAGTVDEGETYASNMVKEAKEELGLSDLKVTAHKELIDTGLHRFYCQYFTAMVDLVVEDFVLAEDEVESVRWVSAIELKRDVLKNPQNYIASFDWEIAHFLP